MAQDRSMSETTTPQDAKAEGFGAKLKAAREAEGISLGDMAVRSRLSVAQLRALESEDMTGLPEPVYVRAFIRGCAHSLGLDGQALVDDYVRRFGSSPDQLTSGVLPTADPGAEPILNAAPRHRGLKLAALFVSIAVVAAGIAAVYTDQFGDLTAKTEAVKTELGLPETEVAANAAEAEPASAQTTAPTALPAATENAEKAPAAEPAAPAAAPAAPSQETPAQAPAPAVAESATALTNAAAADPAAAPSAHRVEFVISQPVWVQVITPEGRNIVAREMRPGDDVEVEVPAGSRFTIGNSEAASIRVDEQPYDLASSTRNGIARFTLQ